MLKAQLNKREREGGRGGGRDERQFVKTTKNRRNRAIKRFVMRLKSHYLTHNNFAKKR